MHREKIPYDSLNGRQQENRNYHKVSAVLADYGYTTIRLSDDYGTGDFLAVHITGEVLTVQLKSRFFIAEKYIGKGLYLAFPDDSRWYIGLHDEAVAIRLKDQDGRPIAYDSSGDYYSPHLSQSMRSRMEHWLI